MMSFLASAPVRLDFAGGWTDVAPFSLREGGSVVNAAIDLRATAELTPGGELYRLVSEDLGEREEAVSLAAPGRLRLHRCALSRSGLGPCELVTRSEAPAGSGLGTSGALGVALVHAIDTARGIERRGRETAEEAWQVEAVDAELAGGRQDQYAAALGGFHYFRFGPGGVEAEAIVLDPSFARELADHTIICYTGASRISSRMIARVMDAYSAGDQSVTGALRGLAALALPMTDALRRGDVNEAGRLLSANWGYQMALDPGMQTAEMAGLEQAMTAAGSLGGKAAGAGAGGCMFFLCDDPVRARRAATIAGAAVLPCSWATQGVRAWLA